VKLSDERISIELNLNNNLYKYIYLDIYIYIKYIYLDILYVFVCLHINCGPVPHLIGRPEKRMKFRREPIRACSIIH